MQISTIKSIESVFVSSQYPNKCFSNSTALITGIDTISSNSYFNTLLKPKYPDYLSSCHILKVNLYLYIKDIAINEEVNWIYTFTNATEINCSSLTWSTKPLVKGNSIKTMFSKRNVNTYIPIDITSLVTTVITKQDPNYGLTLLIEKSPGIAIFSPKNTYNEPYIKIYYDN